MNMRDERESSALKEILQRPGNDACADCGEAGPECVSCSLGVLICLDCSEIHRNLLDHSEVRSLSVADWEDSELEFLANNGNERAKTIFEAAVPAYYYMPTRLDCRVLREQWIKAKYERREFTKPGRKDPYEEEIREGYLMKMGRGNRQFLSRKFVLEESEGTLKYYTKQDAKEPKATIKVNDLNATFQPEKIGHPYGLQLTYPTDHGTRSIFLYHEEGKEMVDWFNAIRAVQFYHLKVAFPGASDQELKYRLTRNFLKEGFMAKTGPKETEDFKRRWFTLDGRRLMYFKDPLDAFARGELFLGHRDHGYHASPGLPSSAQDQGTWRHGLTVSTPDRRYLFTCETESAQQDWLSRLNAVINMRMSPQDYAMEAILKRKN